ncbi:MAG: aminotransferase class IV, partial [Candidatus Omnitrophica bacterium]|nr:aminotransferase class IV [Candidatus Omnitrophota bacterium]
MPWPFDETRVGVFETLGVARGRPVALPEHWRRLCESQRTVGRPVPPPSVRAQIRRAARQVGEGGLRVSLTTMASSPMTVEILPRRLAQKGLSPRGTVPFAMGVTVATATGRAPSVAALPAQVKSIERIPSVLAWGEAAGGPLPSIDGRGPPAASPQARTLGIRSMDFT